MVGTEGVKNKAYELAAKGLMRRERQQEGLPVTDETNHLVFTGNPGVGKTSVARIFKDLYYGLGLVERDHYVEAQTNDLVANYMGQTADKTRKFLEANKGGVIFIDEAYKLTQGSNNEYGQQALDEILTFAEEHRGDTVVILAGYPKHMQQMLGSNPGLQRRFPNVVELPDHDRSDMGKIMGQMMRDNLDKPAPGTKGALDAAMDRLYPHLQTGNAGEVRNLLERIHAARSTRIAQMPQRSQRDRVTITPDDVYAGAEDYARAAEAVRGRKLKPTGRRRTKVEP